MKKQKDETLKSAKPTLQALLARITPENRHPEMDWGEPRAKEVWYILLDWQPITEQLATD